MIISGARGPARAHFFTSQFVSARYHDAQTNDKVIKNMAEDAFAAEMRRRAANQLFLAEPEPPVYSFNTMRAAPRAGSDAYPGRARNFDERPSGRRRLNLFAKSVIFASERRQSSIYSANR